MSNDQIVDIDIDTDDELNVKRGASPEFITTEAKKQKCDFSKMEELRAIIAQKDKQLEQLMKTVAEQQFQMTKLIKKAP